MIGSAGGTRPRGRGGGGTRRPAGPRRPAVRPTATPSAVSAARGHTCCARSDAQRSRSAPGRAAIRPRAYSTISSAHPRLATAPSVSASDVAAPPSAAHPGRGRLRATRRGRDPRRAHARCVPRRDGHARRAAPRSSRRGPRRRRRPRRDVRPTRAARRLGARRPHRRACGSTPGARSSGATSDSPNRSRGTRGPTRGVLRLGRCGKRGYGGRGPPSSATRARRRRPPAPRRSRSWARARSRACRSCGRAAAPSADCACSTCGRARGARARRRCSPTSPPWRRARWRAGTEAADRERHLAVLRAAFEAAVDATIVADRDGRVVHYNAAWLALWRLPAPPPGPLTSAAVEQVVLGHVRDPDAFRARLAEIVADVGAPSFDLLALVDGRTVERRSAPQRVDGVAAGRVWSYRDVTGREAAAAALRERAEQLRAVVEQAGDPMFVCAADGRLLDVNRAACETLGYTRAELLARTLSDVAGVARRRRAGRAPRPRVRGRDGDRRRSQPPQGRRPRPGRGAARPRARRRRDAGPLHRPRPVRAPQRRGGAARERGAVPAARREHPAGLLDRAGRGPPPALRQPGLRGGLGRPPRGGLRDVVALDGRDPPRRPGERDRRERGPHPRRRRRVRARVPGRASRRRRAVGARPRLPGARRTRARLPRRGHRRGRDGAPRRRGGRRARASAASGPSSSTRPTPSPSTTPAGGCSP
jgi:PAS domain-containing protein